MSQLVNVVKRGGERTTEQFDREKLHASILAACLSVRSPLGMAETAAHSVCNIVSSWCEAHPEVTSADLRRIASGHLDSIHPEAAYLYKHHRLVI